MKIAGKRRADPVLDVTPMIDIVFQLVLFFMVSTTFVSSPGIQVDLPRSSAQVVLNDDQDLSVWIALDGSIRVNEQAVDLNKLNDVFRRAAERDPNTLVILKADQGVTHGRVVTVMDIARSRGLARLAIATEAKGSRGDTP